MEETNAPQPRSEETLREVRLELFTRFEAFDSIDKLLALQIALSDEIKRAERAIAIDKDSPEYGHRSLLRRLGDGIAWRCLHPYAIRQLHFAAAPPPNLSNQEGFAETLKAAEELAEQGIPPIICDLTTCLGTGDIVAVSDPEAPMLVECGNPNYSMTPRKQRQMLRAYAAGMQLREGAVHWPDRPMPTVTVDSDTTRENLYPVVEEALNSAMTEGFAVMAVGATQTVFAIGCEQDREPIASLADEMSKPAFALTQLHERYPSPRIAPPHVWPISAELRIAVIESDVMVGHLIDLAAFEGAEAGSARLLESERRPDGIFIKAQRDGEPLAVLPGLIEEALGNYETLESARTAMLEALTLAGPDRMPAKIHSPATKLRTVKSTEDAERLLRRWEAGEISEDDIVGVPRDLLEELREEAARRRDGA